MSSKSVVRSFQLQFMFLNEAVKHLMNEDVWMILYKLLNISEYVNVKILNNRINNYIIDYNSI